MESLRRVGRSLSDGPPTVNVGFLGRGEDRATEKDERSVKLRGVSVTKQLKSVKHCEAKRNHEPVPKA